MIKEVIPLLLIQALPESSPQSDTGLRAWHTTLTNLCFSPLAIKSSKQGDRLIAEDFLKLVIEIESEVFAETHWLWSTFQVLPFSASQGSQGPHWAAQALQHGEPA